MNFLQGLGGVGAGLMTAQQILQKQKESEQRAKSLELQQTEQQMRIDAANTARLEKEDDKLFGKLQNDKVRTAGQAPESGTAGVTPGGEQDKGLAAQMAGMGLTDTDKATYGMDAKGERYGDVQKHQAYAQRAAEKGDIEGEIKYSKYAKLLETEGVDQLWGDLEAGMSPQEAKARYDKTGSLKMGSGEFDYDPKTRSITLEMNGKPITVSRENYEKMKLGYLDRTKLENDTARLEQGDKKLVLDEQRISNQLTLQEMRDTARAMSDDKRFNAMMQAAEVRSKRGELAGKAPTQVATAEWLLANGVAKTKEEAWQKANQLGEAVNEKVTTDTYGNTTVHNPQTGEIVRMDGEGKKTVIRAATKGVDKRPTAVTPHQEYVEAWNRAKGNPELQRKITARARQNGVVK